MSMLRHRSGLTRDQVVEASGIPAGTVSRYMNDDTRMINIETVEAILEALCRRTGDDPEVAWSELRDLLRSAGRRRRR